MLSIFCRSDQNLTHGQAGRTFGEGMMRASVPDLAGLRGSKPEHCYGGAEANVSISLQFNIEAANVTRLPDKDPEKQLVNTSNSAVWYFTIQYGVNGLGSISSKTDPCSLHEDIYDRFDSAFAHINRDDWLGIHHEEASWFTGPA